LLRYSQDGENNAFKIVHKVPLQDKFTTKVDNWRCEEPNGNMHLMPVEKDHKRYPRNNCCCKEDLMDNKPDIIDLTWTNKKKHKILN
jgi:hypothetical protein